MGVCTTSGTPVLACGVLEKRELNRVRRAAHSVGVPYVSGYFGGGGELNPVRYPWTGGTRVFREAKPSYPTFRARLKLEDETSLTGVKGLCIGLSSGGVVRTGIGSQSVKTPSGGTQGWESKAANTRLMWTVRNRCRASRLPETISHCSTMGVYGVLSPSAKSMLWISSGHPCGSSVGHESEGMNGNRGRRG